MIISFDALNVSGFKRKSKTEGRVHMGFKLELRKLWPDIEALLQRNKQKKLWITGHSLGGAMATLCASRLEEKEPKLYKKKNIYCVQ